VKPGKMANILDSHIDDPDLKRFDKEKLSIFIIDNDVYLSEPWDTIRKYNKILKRYELNSKELKDMGGTIVYP